MSDSYEHSPGDHEDPLAGPTWVIGVAGTAILIATVLGVTALFYDVADREIVTKEEQTGPKPADVMREAQLSRLEISRKELRTETGDVAAVVIPIEQGIDLVIPELQGS